MMDDNDTPALPDDVASVFPSAFDGAEEDMVLVFADISGYTRFIWDNRYTQVHAADIVARLLDSVVAALDGLAPLVKLEGDAAFCAGPAPDYATGHQLEAAFDAFLARRDAVAAVNACPCAACMTVDALDLKMIVHRGPVVRHLARTGSELAGVSVIQVHRLAKNGIKARRYILWTEDADALLADLPDTTVTRRVERDPDLGAIAVRVFTALHGASVPLPRTGGWWRRQADHLYKAWLWLPLILRGVPGKAEALAPVAGHGPDQRE